MLDYVSAYFDKRLQYCILILNDDIYFKNINIRYFINKLTYNILQSI